MTMPLELRARHILALAADYMELVGKCVGSYQRTDGSCCAIGAILAMTEDTPAQLCNRAVGLLGKKVSRRRGGIENWSDSHSQAEVVATMRAASGVCW